VVKGNNGAIYLLFRSLTPERRNRSMNFVVTIDWKSILALGASAFVTISAMKMGPDAHERVLTLACDAFKEYEGAVNGCQ